MEDVRYKQKTEAQTKIDKDCGCTCHEDCLGTQNFWWCLHCNEKHHKDERAINKEIEILL